MYTKIKDSKTTIRWECSQRVSKNCKGYLTSDLQIQTTIRTTPHSHDPNPYTTAATKIRSVIKEAAGTSRGTPAQLLADNTAAESLEVRVSMGARESIKRCIRREKAKAFPKSPAGLPDLVMPDEWCTTGTDNEQFLIHDSGPDAADRMLVFASDAALTQLARSDTWHMDGTFDSAPSIFQQLYVIRAPLGESAISCVYAFLSSKTQATYEELITAVLERCSDLGFQPDPTTIITDFEQATINAVSSTLGSDVQSRGCFYHLTQSTWRKVQQLGLVTLYRSDDDVKLFCGMLDGLAFLPVADVPEGLKYLKEHTPEGLEPLIDYFDATYISGSYRRIQRPTGPDGSIPPMKMRRIAPMFPPELWNVHEVTISGESRTNNMCEAWNNSFRSLVGCSHPSIWRTIDNLRKDQNDARAAILLDSRGQPLKKRVHRSTVQLQQRLHNLCTDIRDGRKSVEVTLKGIGHCIRWK